jgi:hypothetical protein
MPVGETRESVSAWGKHLTRILCGDDSALLAERLAIVDDKTMTFFLETCPQVAARVRINQCFPAGNASGWALLRIETFSPHKRKQRADESDRSRSTGLLPR